MRCNKMRCDKMRCKVLCTFIGRSRTMNEIDPVRGRENSRVLRLQGGGCFCPAWSALPTPDSVTSIN
jgi:hypothetical protein